MNALKESTTHVVVQFVGDTGSNNKRMIDLVPRSWLYFTYRWMCYFPEKKDWPMVEKWSKTSKNPEQKWKTWKVEIIKEAGILKLEIIVSYTGKVIVTLTFFT